MFLCTVQSANSCFKLCFVNTKLYANHAIALSFLLVVIIVMYTELFYSSVCFHTGWDQVRDYFILLSGLKLAWLTIYVKFHSECHFGQKNFDNNVCDARTDAVYALYLVIMLLLVCHKLTSWTINPSLSRERARVKLNLSVTSTFNTGYSCKCANDFP